MSKAVVVRIPTAPLPAWSVKPPSRPVCNGCLPKRRGVARKASGCEDLACRHHAACFLCGDLTDGRFVLVATT